MLFLVGFPIRIAQVEVRAQRRANHRPRGPVLVAECERRGARLAPALLVRGTRDGDIVKRRRARAARNQSRAARQNKVLGQRVVDSRRGLSVGDVAVAEGEEVGIDSCKIEPPTRYGKWKGAVGELVRNARVDSKT